MKVNKLLDCPILTFNGIDRIYIREIREVLPQNILEEEPKSYYKYRQILLSLEFWQELLC